MGRDEDCQMEIDPSPREAVGREGQGEAEARVGGAHLHTPHPDARFTRIDPPHHSLSLARGGIRERTPYAIALPLAGPGDPSSLALLCSDTRFHNMPGPPRRPKLFRYPLFRLLAINLAAGLVLAVLLVGGLLWLDPGGLRHLIFTDRSPGVALGLLLFSFMVTFGSTVMGSAIMALGQRERQDDRPRGPPVPLAEEVVRPPR